MLKEGYYFPEQRKEEQIVRFIHRRWLSFLPWIIFISLMVILPIILLSFWRNIIVTSFGPEDIRYFVAGLSAYYLIIMAIFLTSWIGHYLNVVLVTPERLIDIRQNGLFNRVVAEQSLLRVQDVSARMDGFFQTFFLYGTVIVETAGESPNFIIPDLPTPNEVANTILKLHEDLVKKSGFDEEDMSSGVGLESPPNITKKQHKLKSIYKNEAETKKEYSPLRDSSGLEIKFSSNKATPSKQDTKNNLIPKESIIEQKSELKKPESRKETPSSKSVNITETKQMPRSDYINKPLLDSQSVPKKIPQKENRINSKAQEGELEEGIQIKL